MMIEWVGLSTVLAIQERQIAEHGGVPGVRDAALLESALARPLHLAAYGQPDLWDLAAAYAHGLARDHPFFDANKRTAYVVCMVFLRLNGHAVRADRAERVRIFVALGRGDLEREELAGWLREWSIPAGRPVGARPKTPRSPTPGRP